jgi:hypothetical protein
MGVTRGRFTYLQYCTEGCVESPAESQPRGALSWASALQSFYANTTRQEVAGDRLHGNR